jgi:hypothetical protein
VASITGPWRPHFGSPSMANLWIYVISPLRPGHHQNECGGARINGARTATRAAAQSAVLRLKWLTR